MRPVTLAALEVLMRTPMVVTLLLAASVTHALPLVVYDDQLQNGFEDWSWATHNLAAQSPVHTGATSISVEPDGWSALYLHRSAGIDVASYDGVTFFVHGGSAGGQVVQLSALMGGDETGQSVEVTGIAANAWTEVRITFAQLGVTSGILDGIWFQDGSGGDQATVYFDDIVITEREGGPLPPAEIQVVVDMTAPRRPISPLVYGTNYGSTSQLTRLGWPIRRWGGNATTRYSWQHDISNRAADWFFYNIEHANSAPAQLPSGSSADVFVDETLAADTEVLLTVPLIGWTPIDRTRRCGFSVAKYGAQQETECTATNNASWCNPDCGNGRHTDGSAITGNDPTDTSRAIDPDFVVGWMDHLIGRVGTAANGGVRFYALDNEPMLWDSTHRDVHPQPATYDEIWQRTVDYATVIKQRDPDARVLGPAVWGWCAYFGSAADNCVDGNDRQAHGGVPFLQWYLRQVCAHQANTGVRLVDYLDIHYYPQAQGVALDDDESATVSARRLRTVRSLYDSTYQDESWISEPVRLIPRMREWIAQECPGIGLAITEYNFGDGDGASAALAQAEVLAVFGREGVGLATRWVSPDDNSRVEDAFALFLNYDGQGARVEGEAIPTSTSSTDDVGAYAIAGADRTMFVVLINKATGARDVDIAIAGGVESAVKLFAFDGNNRLGALADGTGGVDGFSLQLPARSATLAVVRTANNVVTDGGAPAGSSSSAASSGTSTATSASAATSSTVSPSSSGAWAVPSGSSGNSIGASGTSAASSGTPIASSSAPTSSSAAVASSSGTTTHSSASSAGSTGGGSTSRVEGSSGRASSSASQPAGSASSTVSLADGGAGSGEGRACACTSQEADGPPWLIVMLLAVVGRRRCPTSSHR